jgi:3-oxoadipate enol-lactonase
MKTVTANGIEIAYELQGSGPLLVLCHGGEADHRNFFNLAPLLAKHFTVVAYDQRDTGQTRNAAVDYTLDDLGRDVGALICALGSDDAHVFGTSFGGLVAQCAALECPERVKSLQLSVTFAPRGDGALPVSADYLRLSQESAQSSSAKRALRQQFFSPAFAAEHVDDIEALMDQVLVTRTPEQRARRRQTVLGAETASRLGKLRARTLVISAAEDRIVDAKYSRELAAAIPGAQLIVLPGIGHATTLQAPRQLSDVIRNFALEGEILSK